MIRNIRIMLLFYEQEKRKEEKVASPWAIVNCFQALLNPSSQIDFPVAFMISHYLYTINSIIYYFKISNCGAIYYNRNVYKF